MNKKTEPTQKVAPTIDEEDSYGQDATEKDIREGESTTVTRLVFDEHDPS